MQRIFLIFDVEDNDTEQVLEMLREVTETFSDNVVIFDSIDNDLVKDFDAPYVAAIMSVIDWEARNEMAH